MTNGPTLTPRLLGRAENAHWAVLGRILGASDMTYHEWVALTLASASDSTVASNQLAGHLVGALNIDRATAREAIDRLIASVAPQLRTGARCAASRSRAVYTPRRRP